MEREGQRWRGRCMKSEEVVGKKARKKKIKRIEGGEGGEGGGREDDKNYMTTWRESKECTTCLQKLTNLGVSQRKPAHGPVMITRSGTLPEHQVKCDRRAELQTLKLYSYCVRPGHMAA